MKIKPSILKIAIWAFALVVFYLTIGQIVAFVVLEQIAKAINAHASFLGEWYQILMFVIDIFCLVGLIGSVVLFVLASKKHTGEGKKKNSFLKSFFDRTVWGGISAFMAVLTAIIFVGTGVCQKYSGNINDALKIETMKQINVDDDGEVPIYVPSDYYNEDGSYNDKAMRANSWKVAEEAASESTVVLWNNDNALPLAQNSKIGIFGMAQLKNKFFYTGTGSGYLNPTNGIEKSLSQELRDQNLQVYRNLELAYQYSAKYGMKQISNKQLGIRDINYQEARINDVPWADINATKQGNVTERYSEYEDAAIYIIQRYGGGALYLNF